VASFVEGVGNDAITGIREVAKQAQHRSERRQQVVRLTMNSGDRFRVEPEEVPQVIADLRSALNRVQDLRWQAQTIANTAAPGSDEVSMNVVRQIGQMAMGSDGSLKAALDAYEREIKKTIAGLENDLRTYLGIERANVPPARAWP
jgi:hypothetical protein